MKLVDEITIDLVGYLQRANHLFPTPRFYIGNYECDVFSTTQSGYTVEYEIKTSKADYYKDFEKSNAGNTNTNLDVLSPPRICSCFNIFGACLVCTAHLPALDFSKSL